MSSDGGDVSGGGVADRSSQERKLTAGQQRELCRALATAGKSRRRLATEFGVSHQYLTKFARQRAAEITAIRGRLDDAFAGLWIASKEARLAAYQADYEASANGEYADHFEQIRTRSAILRNVAEELGQLPNRSTAAIIVPVVHVIENVSLDDLK